MAILSKNRRKKLTKLALQKFGKAKKPKSAEQSRNSQSTSENPSSGSTSNSSSTSSSSKTKENGKKQTPSTPTVKPSKLAVINENSSRMSAESQQILSADNLISSGSGSARGVSGASGGSGGDGADVGEKALSRTRSHSGPSQNGPIRTFSVNTNWIETTPTVVTAATVAANLNSTANSVSKPKNEFDANMESFLENARFGNYDYVHEALTRFNSLRTDANQQSLANNYFDINYRGFHFLLS